MGKKLFCFILVIAVVTGTVTPTFATSVADFTDVKPSDWYYDAVDYAASHGLVSGTSSTTFSPDLSMTRSMFVTVLGRLAGVPDSYGRTQTTPFADVTQVDYFFPYAAWAKDNGIVEGSGGRFEPHAEISREQMAAILHRYAEKSGYVLGYSTEQYNTFTDSNSVSGYAIPAMLWATSHGIINGSGGKLNPQGNASRAQVVQIFHNFSQLDAAAPTEPEVPDWKNYNPTYDIPTGKSAVDADGGYYDYDLANELMKRINELRIESGVKALSYHPRTQQYASVRAYEAAIVFSHTRPDGTSCNTVDPNHTIHAENLANLRNCTESELNDTTGLAERTVNGWFNSQAHKQNMLKSVFNTGAISCYVKGDDVFIAHLFSTASPYILDYLVVWVD